MWFRRDAEWVEGGGCQHGVRVQLSDGQGSHHHRDDRGLPHQGRPELQHAHLHAHAGLEKGNKWLDNNQFTGFRRIRMNSRTRKSFSTSSTGSATSRWLRSCTSTSPRPWRARRTWTTSSTSAGRPRRAGPDSRTWESASSGPKRSLTLSQN